MRIAHRTVAGLAVLATGLSLTACGPGYKRNPVPLDRAADAAVPGYDGFIRVTGNNWEGKLSDFDTDHFQTNLEQLQGSGVLDGDVSLLTISGGGQNGAFGAGLLYGWTERGDRPEFWYVSGISTGALTAPLAFLGPEYDETLKTVYTTLSTSDLIKPRGLIRTITGDGAVSVDKLKEQIAKNIDEEAVRKIGEEWHRGRRLFIGTTNLDVMEIVYWDITRIAASGNPGATELIHQIMLASASIPAAFPPVYIDVEVDGEAYEEMHVDGGTATQVFAYPGSYDLDAVASDYGFDTSGWNIYVVRNARLATTPQLVEPSTLSIAARSIASLIRSQGIGDLYQIYLITERDGLDFNLAIIPDDFTEKADEAFDTEFMVKLFERGRTMALEGYPWKKEPPTFVED